MNATNDVSTLKLFIEKADKLKNSTFIKRILDNSGVDFSMGYGKPTTAMLRGPDTENTDAFILTFRFFIQDNEKISLRNIKDIFHSSIATDEEKTNYDQARTNLNAYLDGETMFTIGHKITRRELMDVFIYGGLSHANPQKKAIYDKWMDTDILAQFMRNEFSVIIFEVLNIIIFVRNLSETMLNRTNA